jgi:DNA-binding LacI/PurR family transcriptional regulator
MAGVSPSTVSLVLSGKAGKRRISEDTHTRVNQAATALGYTPNLLHRSMRRGRTHVLSFYNAFRNREWSDLYMDRMSAGVEHAGGSYGYDVLVHCNYDRTTQETYEFLNGGFADGVILFGPSADDPLLPLLAHSNLPTVVIGPRGDVPGLSVVRDDTAEGMRLTAQALREEGHTHIAAVVDAAGGVVDPTGRLRLLQAEFAAHGISVTDRDVVLWNDSPEATLAKVLALRPQPTALFVWHDRAAYQILEACEAAGLRVPEDLSVVGYDGLVWPSRTGHVVASTLVALDEFGRAAIRILDRLIDGEPGPISETIPISFQRGTTVGPPHRPALVPTKEIL